MTHNGNSLGETPNTGKTFGCERRLQIMISWNKRCHELLKAGTHVRSLAANLLDFGQVVGRVGPERFYAHTTPTMAASPNIGEASGSERDITLL